MKIDNTPKALGGLSSTDSRVRSAPASASAAPVAGEKVQLSSLSATLKRADAAIESAPVVNRARVDEIRQAISEGRFKVDAHRIADGLIESVRDMLAAQPPRS